MDYIKQTECSAILQVGHKKDVLCSSCSVHIINGKCILDGDQAFEWLLALQGMITTVMNSL